MSVSGRYLNSLDKELPSYPLDCIYVTASSRDARYTRMCVASIRYFYPNAPVKLLMGGKLERGLANELARFWNVSIADVPLGEYGWGFVKLEPLFGPPGERFLVLDSDTVVTGPVLDLWAGDAPFLVDEEFPSEIEIRRLYFDWLKLRAIDLGAQAPAFVFNSGQWFGTAGVVKREDFSPWLEWAMPRRLRRPEMFMPGEQGILNYVLNKKTAAGCIEVARRKIMCWPGHSMRGITAESIENRAAEPLIIHWAGMKKPRLSRMVGADVATFFERQYYRRMPLKTGRRLTNLGRHFMGELNLRVQLRVARWAR